MAVRNSSRRSEVTIFISALYRIFYNGQLSPLKIDGDFDKQGSLMVAQSAMQDLVQLFPGFSRAKLFTLQQKMRKDMKVSTWVQVTLATLNRAYMVTEFVTCKFISTNDQSGTLSRVLTSIQTGRTQ